MSKPFYMGPVPPRTLRADDYQRVASMYGLPEAKLRAVVEVEAAGKGFHSSGALTALYEPHIAYRYTTGAVRDKLVREGLAYPKWRRNYPRSSYPRIDRCAEIAGEEVAALSTSFGLPQMMGFNHAVCGYETAVDMVKAFAQGEEVQLIAMMEFIRKNPKMFTALHNNDWATFARLYNGPGYAKNAYDKKLKAAYAKWLDRGLERGASVPRDADYPEADVRTPDVHDDPLHETEQHWLVRLIKEFVKWLTRSTG